MSVCVCVCVCEERGDEVDDKTALFCVDSPKQFSAIIYFTI